MGQHHFSLEVIMKIRWKLEKRTQVVSYQIHFSYFDSINYYYRAFIYLSWRDSLQMSLFLLYIYVHLLNCYLLRKSYGLAVVVLLLSYPLGNCNWSIQFPKQWFDSIKWFHIIWVIDNFNLKCWNQMKTESTWLLTVMWQLAVWNLPVPDDFSIALAQCNTT